jgi:hypothetical protein
MDNLTATELKTLNNISRSLNPEVSLGNKLQEIIGVVGETGTPSMLSLQPLRLVLPAFVSMAKLSQLATIV